MAFKPPGWTVGHAEEEPQGQVGICQCYWGIKEEELLGFNAEVFRVPDRQLQDQLRGLGGQK
jgi:hypothetical protein